METLHFDRFYEHKGQSRETWGRGTLKFINGFLKDNGIIKVISNSDSEETARIILQSKNSFMNSSYPHKIRKNKI